MVLKRSGISEAEFISEFQQIGGTGIAQKYGILERNVYQRRRSIEKRRGIAITAPTQVAAASYPGRVPLELKNGTILVGSDFHIWPGEESTCLRAFKKFVSDIKPDIVIANGDVCDFPRISRHPMSWEKGDLASRF